MKNQVKFLINRVSELRKNSSPVLIGTTSIEQSETISELLRKKHPHNGLMPNFMKKKQQSFLKPASLVQ